MMVHEEQYPRGVFRELVNKRGFVDRIVLSVWGIQRKRHLPWMKVLRNKAIGGKGRYYARCLEAEHTVTGNPFEVRYGLLKKFRSLPTCRVDLRSDRVPLTGAQTAHVLQCLLRKGYRGHIALIEVTFDLEGFPIKGFSRELLTRARTSSERVGRLGRRTFYIGGPRSTWQARVYQKAPSITRVEFILRRPFLLSNFILVAHDAVALNSVEFSKLASWKRADPRRLRKALAYAPSGWKKNFLSNWPIYLPTQLLVEILRNGWRVSYQDVLRPSEAERLIRKMAKRFLW